MTNGEKLREVMKDVVETMPIENLYELAYVIRNKEIETDGISFDDYILDKVSGPYCCTCDQCDEEFGNDRFSCFNVLCSDMYKKFSKLEYKE